jgi:hypothetical protein
MDPDLLPALKALSDPQRLRIVGRLAGGPASLEMLAAELALPLAVVVRHVRVLRSVGLVGPARPGPAGAGPGSLSPARPGPAGPGAAGRDAAGPGRATALVLRVDALQGIGRRLDELEHGSDRSALPGRDGDALPVDDARILRGYVEDGRLTTIPAQEKKRIVVLRWLRDRVFTEDREYPEKEVNQRLALFHPDVASLRRYMVDSGLVTRTAGEYRRVGR